MIFTAEHLHLIRGGRKTQTRRVARTKAGPLATIATAEQDVKACTYQPARTYAVQRGRKQPGEFRILVTSVRLEQLDAISDDDARREGYQHATAYRRAWQKINGAWKAEQLVWVISFEVARDEIRLLAKRGGYTSHEGQALGFDPKAPPRLRAANVEAEAVPAVTQFEITEGLLRVATPFERANSDGVDGLSAPSSVEIDAQLARSALVRGEPKPAEVATPARKPGLHDLAENALRQRITRHEGLTPEQVHEVDLSQGTPGEIRRRRREMGLRGIDGLLARPVVELEQELARLVAASASVRTVAYAMDWSHGKAQRYLAEQREKLAA